MMVIHIFHLHRTESSQAHMKRHSGNPHALFLDNIQKLHFMLNLEDMSAINKEFSDVWNSNDIDKLREFNEKLNVLVEVYRI